MSKCTTGSFGKIVAFLEGPKSDPKIIYNVSFRLTDINSGKWYDGSVSLSKTNTENISNPLRPTGPSTRLQGAGSHLASDPGAFENGDFTLFTEQAFLSVTLPALVTGPAKVVLQIKERNANPKLVSFADLDATTGTDSLLVKGTGNDGHSYEISFFINSYKRPS